MERQKREINIIIIHFVFYFILTIWLFFYLFSSIIPEIMVIEKIKTDTKKLYNDIEKTKKSWLTFSEFKSNNNSSKNTMVVNKILEEITESFYEKNLQNNDSATYQEFLDNKKNELNSTENRKIVEDKSMIISKVLPPYSDVSIAFPDNALTDFKFINYVESIIETFNFSTNDPIWISKITLVDDFAMSTSKNNSLEASIYYIPLSMNLKWTKSWIIDFLYFIENVGNIDIKDNDVIINNEYSFLSKNGVKRTLVWSKVTDDYNIFENQMIDIDKITMKQYIDNSYKSRWKREFLEFIAKDQWNEYYEISLNLLFYVKWQPTYKIEEFITSVLDKHRESTNLVDSKLKDKKTEWIELINFTKNKEVLKQLNSEVDTIRKWLSKKDKLEELYKKTIKIDDIIEPIFKNLKK